MNLVMRTRSQLRPRREEEFALDSSSLRSTALATEQAHSLIWMAALKSSRKPVLEGASTLSTRAREPLRALWAAERGRSGGRLHRATVGPCDFIMLAMPLRTAPFRTTTISFTPLAPCLILQAAW